VIKLEGGFINKVCLVNGTVVKEFDNDRLVGISSAQRVANEARALLIFGGTIAPRLLYVDGPFLGQEFIEGELYETKARRGEWVFKVAGQCLRKIHDKYSGGFMPRLSYCSRFNEAIRVAGPILELEQLAPKFEPPWEVVEQWGIKYIHGDFWLGNIIGKDGQFPRVIDWEFSDIRSPYEDFAIAELWIFREFPGSCADFWDGYGIVPNQSAINSFLILRCVEFLATTNIEEYVLEGKDGFYHNKISVLRSLCLRPFAQ